MNLVDLIKEQLRGEVAGQLSALIGVSEAQIKSALSAAIPALLSAFSGMASSGGSEKLASALNEFNPGSVDRFTGEMSQQPGEALNQGNQLLDLLLGGSTLSGLAAVLQKFTGIDAATVKKLLAYVAPLVMGVIAKQLQGKPATAQSVKGLMADQNENIAQAMPAGLSLAGIPGLSEIGSLANSSTAAVRKAADMTPKPDSSLIAMLLPIGALALVAILAWQYFQRDQAQVAIKGTNDRTVASTVQKPVLDATDAIPDATKVSNGLTSIFARTTETLSEVKDVESAEAAVPELNKLNSQIDGLSLFWNNVPAEARSTIIKLVTEQIGKLTDLIEKVKAIPGVGDKLEPVLNSIVTKLKTFEAER